MNGHEKEPIRRISERRLMSSKMARPERFELPTDRFEADYSIQLSYERLILFVSCIELRLLQSIHLISDG
jgi:hypothetical protein